MNLDRGRITLDQLGYTIKITVYNN